MNKIHSVIQVLHDNNIDIACVQETWLSSENSVTTAIIKEAGYNIDHVFRTKVGAGVAILSKKKFESLKCKCKVPTKVYSSLQYQYAVFNFDPKIIIISIYGLQEFSFTLFLADLESLINDHFNSSYSLVLIGDFNVHFEKTELGWTILLSDLASSFGLSQLFNGPTHKLGHTLDLTFLNTFELDVTSSFPLDVGISDHFPSFLTLNNLYKANCNVPTTKRISRRDIRAINLEEFSADLCSQLDDLPISEDFQTHYKNFSYITNSTLERHAPLQTKTVVTKNQIPWQDSEYRNERALRRKLERKWRKSGKQKYGPERAAYTEQRSKCSTLASLKRSQYFSNLIQKNEGDHGSMFKIVSQVLDKKKSSSTLPKFDNPVNLTNFILIKLRP